ncbi:MAG TPA: bifunctional oligoribonuclease/PAP phosphatase NrnA [Candidatus Pygmaiobacter gallistercoris]|nr:bifunctional oligoribonuclease/PAP phosphatase NrnA [Candidatus Pygmaiobacter gallistercoris]
MTEQIDLAKAVQMLTQAEDILLICHKNPDGDTLGSAGALLHALQAIGKRTAIFCSDPIADRYDYMQLTLYDGSWEPGFVVAVDVAGTQLFGEPAAKYLKRVDLCIDHHPSNSGYAEATLLDPEAGANAELVYQLIGQMPVEFTPVMADCLYTGVSTDTGCFKFANTTPRTHHIAAELMERGASFVKLNELLFESKSQRRLAIEQIALSHLEYHFDGRCALMYVTREEIENTGADSNDLEGITGIPRMIEGVVVGITMRQLESGSYKVSVRTAGEIDACKICAALGGGGHIRASGCEFFGNLENAKAAVLAEVKKQI